MIYDVSFVILHFSILILIYLLIVVSGMKNKSPLKRIFQLCFIPAFIWAFGQLLEVYARNIFGKTFMPIVYFYYIGVCLSPVMVFYLGLYFYFNDLRFKKTLSLFLIHPAICYILLITNNYHHLLYKKFSVINTELVYGKLFFQIYMIPLYVYVLAGFGLLIAASAKSSSLFSKQLLLVTLSCFIPFVINVAVTLRLVELPTYNTPASFSVCFLLWYLAIIRYQLLYVLPVAFKQIFDTLSDAVLIVNENMIVMNYNKAFIKSFESVLDIKINLKLDLLNINDSNIKMHLTELYGKIKLSQESKKNIKYETNVTLKGESKYYLVELLNISTNKGQFLGTIIIIKNITESKEIEKRILGQERLATLGYLIGSISHNLKTPIMSAGCVYERIKDLITEYKDSIYDDSVTREDHTEIARDMDEWIEKLKDQITYISDIVSAARDQAVTLNASSGQSFTLGELIKRINILFIDELTKNKITLKHNIDVDTNIIIYCEITSLLQIIYNLIINSMQSYDGKQGIIELTFKLENENLVISVKDYGRGIPKNIQERLFKQMVTTKGNKGNGIGLYFSYSTIKGRFGGDLNFESEENTGSTFYIKIPLNRTTI